MGVSGNDNGVNVSRAALLVLVGAISIVLAVALDVVNTTGVRDGLPLRPEPYSTATNPDPAAVSVTVARITAEGTAMFAGRATAGTIVDLKDRATVVGTAETDTRGEWVIVPEVVLAAGAHWLTVGERIDGGPAAGSSGRTVLVVVRPGQPPPSADNRTTSTVLPPLPPLAVKLPGAGGGLPELLQPRPAVPAAAAPTVDIVLLSADGSLNLAGRSHPRERIRIGWTPMSAGQTRADDFGLWSFVIGSADSGGNAVSLRIESLDRRSQRTPAVTPMIDRSAASAPTIGGGGPALQADGGFWRVSAPAGGDAVAVWIGGDAVTGGAARAGAGSVNDAQ